MSPLLNTADALAVGADAVTKAYLGADQVWPSTPDFDPADYGMVIAWFDATQITGKSDGDTISQWDDASGAGANVAQATPANRPVYKAGILNGRPVVRFDGVNDSLQINHSIPQPYTVFAVGYWRSAYGSARRVLLSGKSGFDGYLYRGSDTSTNIYSGGDAISATTTPQAAHVYSAQYSGLTSFLRVDGGAPATGNAPDGLAGIELGASAPNTEWGDVDIAEVIFYAGTLDATNRQGVEAGLKGKWGTP